MPDQRTYRLQKLFKRIVDGKQALNNQYALFLEAIHSEPDPLSCISRLFASTHGMNALCECIWAGMNADFINQHTQPVLQYFRKLEASIFGVDLLQKLLRKLMDPPVFWHELVDLLEARVLTDESLDMFAWLLLQLVSLPGDDAEPFIEVAQRPVIKKTLSMHPLAETRNTYQQILHVVSILSGPVSMNDDGPDGPGGRHDNDFKDFRKISILPTADELASSKKPFLRLAKEIDEFPVAQKLRKHIDNHFRLSRADMLQNILEENQASGNKQRRALRIPSLRLIDVNADGKNEWSLVFECEQDIPGLPKIALSGRKKFLEQHHRILSNGSLCCLVADETMAGTGTVWRRLDELSEQRPRIHIQLSDSGPGMRHLLARIKSAREMSLLQLATPVFAYKPVLKQLQSIVSLPMAESIVNWNPGDTIQQRQWEHEPLMVDFLRVITAHETPDLQHRLELPNTAVLNNDQRHSLISGLSQATCLIQGPPGTGKSFIGALIAKAIMRFTSDKILVLSFTNHALDQYLEDLQSIGILDEEMVRLGNPDKASSNTKKLVLGQQETTRFKLSRSDWTIIDNKKAEATSTAKNLRTSFQTFFDDQKPWQAVFDYLEILHPEYFEAFQIPSAVDGFHIADRRGKASDPAYLLKRWCRNQDAGHFSKSIGVKASSIWQTAPEQRKRLLREWVQEMEDEQLSNIAQYGERYNSHIEEIKNDLTKSDRATLATKRIIGCTTSVAAKSFKTIQSVAPAIVIVEEAGEILESHILTAIGPKTKQLILIGDHKQLRPKVSFDLSVENGHGYDLNRSLFERLVLKGYPHAILTEQHRMRPEISALVRSLTYPGLQDAKSTKSRDQLRGFQNNVIFIDHKIEEDEVHDSFESREGSSGSSKRNRFEAQMTLRCVRYLAQQGYQSNEIVVLTPYLGQLRELSDTLKSDNDPVLSDIDSYDLVRAGLMPAASAATRKRQLRISTIDNYQGEESKVVVASLTRSNGRGEIGFMSAPERLNVLLSRARDGLILIGNASTFISARKGKEIWTRLLDLLKERSSVYDGVPIRCERHSNRESILRTPQDFDELCPDGGCNMGCSSKLKCGHMCPQKCHQLFDHSKMSCDVVVDHVCDNGHQSMRTVSYTHL